MGRPRTEIELATPEFPLVGWHVMYRISRVQIKLDDLRALLDQHGFGTFVPQPPATRIALHRAVADWVDLLAATGNVPTAAGIFSAEADEDGEEDGGAPSKKQSLIREVPAPADNPWLVFALVDEAADVAQLSLSYATSLRILLHKQHGHLICTTTPRGIVHLPDDGSKRRSPRTSRQDSAAYDPEQAVAEAARVLAESEAAAGADGVQLTRQLRPLWEQYRSLVMSNEVSRIIRRIIASMSSVAVRGRGGVYFVPYKELDALQRLNRFIADLPTPSLPASSERRPFLYASGVIDRPASKQQLAVALHAGIMDEVDAARKKLERFTEMEEGTVRPTTILERLAEFRQVKAKAAVYADLCGLQQESVANAIKALEARAMEVVMKGDVVLDPETMDSERPTVKPAVTPASAATTPPPAEPSATTPRSEQPDTDTELLALLDA